MSRPPRPRAAEPAPSPEPHAAARLPAADAALPRLRMERARILELEGAPLRVAEALPAAWIDGQLAPSDARAHGDGHVRAQASALGDDGTVLVRGELEARLVVPCARCLSDAEVEADTEVVARFVPRARVVAHVVASVREAASTGLVAARAGRPARAGATTRPPGSSLLGAGTATRASGSPRPRSAGSAGEALGRTKGRGTSRSEADEGIELADEDLDVVPYEGEILDLGLVLGELLRAAYPMRALCRAGEGCLGLCSGCGADLNVDREVLAAALARGSAPRCSRCQAELGERSAALAEAIGLGDAPVLAAAPTGQAPADAPHEAWKATLRKLLGSDP